MQARLPQPWRVCGRLCGWLRRLRGCVAAGPPADRSVSCMLPGPARPVSAGGRPCAGHLRDSRTREAGPRLRPSPGTGEPASSGARSGPPSSTASRGAVCGSTAGGRRVTAEVGPLRLWGTQRGGQRTWHEHVQLHKLQAGQQVVGHQRGDHDAGRAQEVADCGAPEVDRLRQPALRPGGLSTTPGGPQTHRAPQLRPARACPRLAG